jgi:hypothetical protein
MSLVKNVVIFTIMATDCVNIGNKKPQKALRYSGVDIFRSEQGEPAMSQRSCAQGWPAGQPVAPRN